MVITRYNVVHYVVDRYDQGHDSVIATFDTPEEAETFAAELHASLRANGAQGYFRFSVNPVSQIPARPLADYRMIYPVEFSADIYKDPNTGKIDPNVDYNDLSEHDVMTVDAPVVKAMESGNKHWVLEYWDGEKSTFISGKEDLKLSHLDTFDIKAGVIELRAELYVAHTSHIQEAVDTIREALAEIGEEAFRVL